jgi:hypothetical protein
MPYTCNDINKLIASDGDIAFDNDAFLLHIESCPICRELASLDPETEMVLRSLLPLTAPDSISQNVLRAIDLETKHSGILSAAKHIRYALIGSLYFVIAVIAIFNYKILASAIGSTQQELGRIWGFTESLGAVKESLTAYPSKIVTSPLFLIACVGAVMLLWFFSILRIWEITK